MYGQLFDQLSNPKVTISIHHPPGLGLKINKVSFNPSSGNNANLLEDMVIQDFVSNGVDVLDRSNLNAILAEHNFNLSGYIDKQKAVEIGKIIGPSALITIKVLRYEYKTENLYRDEKRVNYQTKQEYVVRVYIAKTSVYFTASIQTTDLTTGRIFSAQTYSLNPALQNESAEGKPEAPSEYDVQQKAFNYFTYCVNHLFFAWDEPTTLYFFDDKDGGLKQAYQALKSGNINYAHELSLKNLDNCKNDSTVKPKILAHAYYNVGMTNMIRSDFPKAIESFQESEKIRPGGIVTNAIRDCKRAYQLMQELQKVEEKASLEVEKNEIKKENQAASQELTTLKNEDIIILTQKKLPVSLIIQKIKTSDCKFDTTTDALLKLSSSGVDENVIIEMMNKK